MKKHNKLFSLISFGNAVCHSHPGVDAPLYLANQRTVVGRGSFSYHLVIVVNHNQALNTLPVLELLPNIVYLRDVHKIKSHKSVVNRVGGHRPAVYNIAFPAVFKGIGNVYIAFNVFAD